MRFLNKYHKLRVSTLIWLVPMLLMWGACEDQIILDLDESEPLIVIAGEISNKYGEHQITVHRSVSVYSDQLQDPVSGAYVQVRDDYGNAFIYEEVTPGHYRSRPWSGRIGGEYSMQVRVGENVYRATSVMPPMVAVDSIGIATNSFMGQQNNYISLKFTDPAGVANYYRYMMSINGEPYRFVGIMDDKFTDGKVVSHDLFDMDRSLESGDHVSIQRQHVDYGVFRYWQRVGMANPAESVPANPPSNINGGALGYFSAFSLQEYELDVEDLP